MHNLKTGSETTQTGVEAVQSVRGRNCRRTLGTGKTAKHGATRELDCASLYGCACVGRGRPHSLRAKGGFSCNRAACALEHCPKTLSPTVAFTLDNDFIGTTAARHQEHRKNSETRGPEGLALPTHEFRKSGLLRESRRRLKSSVEIVKNFSPCPFRGWALGTSAPGGLTARAMFSVTSWNRLAILACGAAITVLMTGCAKPIEPLPADLPSANEALAI